MLPRSWLLCPSCELRSPKAVNCPGRRALSPAEIRGLGPYLARGSGRVPLGGSGDDGVRWAELQALLLGTQSIDGFLQELATLAARTLGDDLSCGITLQPNGSPMAAH